MNGVTRMSIRTFHLPILMATLAASASLGCSRGDTEPTKERLSGSPAVKTPEQPAGKAKVATAEAEPGSKVVAEPPKGPAFKRDVTKAAGEEKTAATASPVVAAGNQADATGAGKAASSSKTKAVQLATVEGLSIKRLVVTSGIDKREPVDDGGVRADGSPVYAFLEVKNDSTDDRSLIVTFEREDGTKVGKVPLKVPGKQPRWRTWGRTRQIRKAGAWHVVVRTKGGDEIGRAKFAVSQG